MGRFLDLFPKVSYKIDGGKFSDYQIVTNLTFRIGMVQETLANASSYYQYIVRDGETPESLADKFYGDSQAHWIILYANNILDPQYGWPLNYRDFHNYIIDKYGSVETAKTTWHHYEKVITRENQTENTITVTRFRINSANVANTIDPSLSNIPYDTYTSLEETAYSTTNVVNGKTVIETVSRDRISNYDWELQENDNKRNIKVIKKEYYPTIMKQLNELTGSTRNNPMLRRP